MVSRRVFLLGGAALVAGCGTEVGAVPSHQLSLGRRTRSIPPTSTGGSTTPPPDPGGGGTTTPSVSSQVFITDAELASLPTSGAAWTFLNAQANATWSALSLANQNSYDQSKVLGAALVWRKTGRSNTTLRNKIISAINTAQGTESIANQLALYRTVGGYAMAAAMIELSPAALMTGGSQTYGDWFQSLVMQTATGGQDNDRMDWCTTRLAHNWAAYARWSWLCVANFRGATADVATIEKTYRAFCGDISDHVFTGTTPAYDQAKTESDWATVGYPTRQGAINPLSSDKRSGFQVEDGSRGLSGSGDGWSGSDSEPWLSAGAGSQPVALDGNDHGMIYQYGALDGNTATAILLYHLGYPNSFGVANDALKRNLDWCDRHGGRVNLVDAQANNYTLSNHVYGTSYAASPDVTSRAFGYTNWLCAPGSTWLKG